jgi:hypothetical protein
VNVVKNNVRELSIEQVSTNARTVDFLEETCPTQNLRASTGIKTGRPGSTDLSL